MRTLHGADLALTLRKLSDEAKYRVSIVSPYIGRWPAVSALLGANWWLGATVQLRVITDISELSDVNRGTLLSLMNRGLVRTLTGVHAKIYIIDAQAIVTSANLTETAFSKRREIGVHLDATEADATIRIFEAWWRDLAKDISDQVLSQWTDKLLESPFALEDQGNSLPTLWPLPQKPSDGLFSPADSDGTFTSYRKFLENYKDLTEQYESVQRLWPDAPLFLEIDAFLNYLFHDADDRPAFQYHEAHEARKISSAERKAEIAVRAASFKDWVNRSPNDERWREKDSETVQTLLAKDRIDDLTEGEAKQVADCLNCMNARQLNKYKFLNPANNSIEAIREAWKDLLHGSGGEQDRLQRCNDALRFFGTSSVQELLGWFYPHRYPIRNSNSDAGLRFLGFQL